MTLTLEPKKTVCLFDKYSLVIPPELKWWPDGLPGKRVLFITDPQEIFTISFEEGMRLMDTVPDHPDVTPTLSFQCSKDGKRIHQIRSDPQKRKGIGNYAFFHIELEDDDGSTLYLPGLMTAKAEYQWSDGVEPVLLDILNGVAVCKVKGGGTS